VNVYFVLSYILLPLPSPPTNLSFHLQLLTNHLNHVNISMSLLQEPRPENDIMILNDPIGHEFHRVVEDLKGPCTNITIWISDSFFIINSSTWNFYKNVTMFSWSVEMIFASSYWKSSVFFKPYPYIFGFSLIYSYSFSFPHFLVFVLGLHRQSCIRLF